MDTHQSADSIHGHPYQQNGSFSSATPQMAERWALKQRDPYSTSKKVQPLAIGGPMSQTLQNNINKGKFLTTIDNENVGKVNKLNQLKPLKQRIEEAERQQFWSDFSGEPGGKDSSSMQRTGASMQQPLS